MSDWLNLSAIPIADALALLRRNADRGIEETLGDIDAQLIEWGCPTGKRAEHLQKAREMLTARRDKDLDEWNARLLAEGGRLN